MFHTIVVGSDDSNTARQAVVTAADIARMSGGSLVIVTVFDPKSVRVQDLPADLRLSTTVHPADVLLSSLAQIGRERGVAVSVEAVTGAPAEGVVKVAEQVGADLIVVGNKGMKGTRRVLGSVPELGRPFGTVLGADRGHRGRRLTGARHGSTLGGAWSRSALLLPPDWQLIRDVRLRSLLESPQAFTSTYVREAAFDESAWRDRATSGRWFAAVEDGRAIGVAVGVDGWSDDPGRRELVGMWVDPSHRGRGISRNCSEPSATGPAPEGASVLSLGVRAGNRDARAAYLRLGLRPAGTTPMVGGDRSDVIEIMELDLARTVTGPTRRPDEPDIASRGPRPSRPDGPTAAPPPGRRPESLVQARRLPTRTVHATRAARRGRRGGVREAGRSRRRPPGSGVLPHDREVQGQSSDGDLDGKVGPPTARIAGDRAGIVPGVRVGDGHGPNTVDRSGGPLVVAYGHGTRPGQAGHREIGGGGGVDRTGLRDLDPPARDLVAWTVTRPTALVQNGALALTNTQPATSSVVADGKGVDRRARRPHDDQLAPRRTSGVVGLGSVAVPRPGTVVVAFPLALTDPAAIMAARASATEELADVEPVGDVEAGSARRSRGRRGRRRRLRSPRCSGAPGAWVLRIVGHAVVSPSSYPRSPGVPHPRPDKATTFTEEVDLHDSVLEPGPKRGSRGDVDRA